MPQARKRVRIEDGRLYLWSFAIEMKADVLSVFAFVTSIVGILIACAAFLGGPDVRIVRAGTAYLAVDKTGNGSVPIVVLSDVLIFNRASPPQSDIVEEYNLTISLPNGGKVCVHASDFANVLWLGAARRKPLDQIGIAENDDLSCSNCLGYQRLRIQRLGRAFGPELPPRSGTKQSIEFALVEDSACDERSRRVLRNFSFERLFQAVPRPMDLVLDVETYLDHSHYQRCTISLTPDVRQYALEHGWTSQECSLSSA